MTYITTDHKKKKTAMAQFSSSSPPPPPPPSAAAAFLPHFVTPRLSPSVRRQRPDELSPLIQMREVSVRVRAWVCVCV